MYNFAVVVKGDIVIFCDSLDELVEHEKNGLVFDTHQQLSAQIQVKPASTAVRTNTGKTHINSCPHKYR